MAFTKTIIHYVEIPINIDLKTADLLESYLYFFLLLCFVFADECLFMFSHVLCYYDVHMKTIRASSSSFIINQNSTTVLYCFFVEVFWYWC